MKAAPAAFCVDTDISILAVTTVKIRSAAGNFVAKHWPALEQNLLTEFGNFDSQTVSRNFAGSLNK